MSMPYSLRWRIHDVPGSSTISDGTPHPHPDCTKQPTLCMYAAVCVLHGLQAAPRMSPEHLQRMQALRAAGIAKHGKSPALGVPRRAAADCTIDEGSYVRVRGTGHCCRLRPLMAECVMVVYADGVLCCASVPPRFCPCQHLSSALQQFGACQVICSQSHACQGG
jgi:hypothetical protein